MAVDSGTRVGDPTVVTVVSGLPRSGTSMMMRMLDAGGMGILDDGARPPDEDNPLGYFEHAATKRLERDASWIPQARGRAVKIVSPLLVHLPEGESYRVVFMDRDLREVLASQREMLRRRGEEPGDTSEEPTLLRSFERHLVHVRAFLAERRDVDALFVSHRETLSCARAVAERVAAFLAIPLDPERMATAVDRRFHRQRG